MTDQKKYATVVAKKAYATMVAEVVRELEATTGSADLTLARSEVNMAMLAQAEIDVIKWCDAGVPADKGEAVLQVIDRLMSDEKDKRLSLIVQRFMQSIAPEDERIGHDRQEAHRRARGVRKIRRRESEMKKIGR